MEQKQHKKNGVKAGLFFIAATVSAIIGLKLYDPILTTTNYLEAAAHHSSQITWGAVMELILICSMAGTAIMLFPYLRKFDLRLGLGYVVFRLLEGVFILIGIVAMLAILTLSQSYLNTANANLEVYQAAGTIVKAIHDWTFILGPLFILGINTSIYSYVFYRTQLVPRKLATLGIAGAVLVFISALLVMFGVIAQLSTLQILMAMPIAIYEMVLAGWLISKGFNLSYLKSNSEEYSLTQTT